MPYQAEGRDSGVQKNGSNKNGRHSGSIGGTKGEEQQNNVVHAGNKGVSQRDRHSDEKTRVVPREEGRNVATVLHNVENRQAGKPCSRAVAAICNREGRRNQQILAKPTVP
jgi:hypothetical protein